MGDIPMVSYKELIKLHEEKIKISEKERLIYNQRKKEIADLAEQCGMLTLPDEEIKSGFYNLVQDYYKN
jgi:hypothetical protein